MTQLSHWNTFQSIVASFLNITVPFFSFICTQADCSRIREDKGKYQLSLDIFFYQGTNDPSENYLVTGKS